MERELTLADFADSVGRTYDVATGDRRVGLTLDRVAELPSGIRSGGSFRLEFLGPAEPVLPQSIYPFEDGGERFEIFIVPIGSEPGGTRYEAIFF